MYNTFITFNSIYYLISFIITTGLFICSFLLTISLRKKYSNYYLLRYKHKPNPFSLEYVKDIFFSQEDFLKKYRRNFIILWILFIISAVITGMLS